MLCSTSAGSGRVQSGETDAWLRPAKGFQPGARRGLIYCHQGTASGLSPIDAANFASTVRLVQGIASAGWPAGSQDLGGTSHMGNTTAQTRVGQTDAWTIASSGDGPKASTAARVVLGISQGASAAINYYGKSPGHVSDVSALILVVPAWDLDRLYQNDVSGLRAAIGTAWGVTYPTALPAGANPKDNTTLLNGKPTLILHASDDPICDATEAALMKTAFGTANTTVVDLGAVGHDGATGAIDIEGVVLPWLRTNAAA